MRKLMACATLCLTLAAFLWPGAVMKTSAAPLDAHSRARKTSSAPASLPLQQEENPPGECYNLDVVFLVDQSTSMSGEFGTPPNDPFNEREYAPEFMGDLLSDIALDQCESAYHRMAVVSYGSEARLDLPLTDIAPDTFPAAQDIHRRVRDAIVADKMGQTDPQKAFTLAAQILNDAAPVGEGIRKRVAIFVTDGIPCVKELGCDRPNVNTMDFNAYARQMRDDIAANLPFDPTLLEQEKCLDQLRTEFGEDIPPDRINQCMIDHRVEDSAYQNSTYIFMLLLKSGEAYPRGLRDIYVDIVQKHAGKLYDLTGAANEVPTTFNKIIAILAGIDPVRLTCGQFAVNPYLAWAKIVLYKINDVVTVKLSYTDERGVTHEISGGQPTSAGGFDVAEYYAYGANERYVLTRPYPGIWTLASDDCAGFDAFYEPVAIATGSFRPVLPQIAQYDREPYYDANRQYFIDYQLHDTAGEVILQAEPPRLSVNVIATVTGPDGAVYLYPMKWVAAEKLFRTVDPLQVPIPGTYTFDLLGHVYLHDGEPSPLDSNNYNQVFSSRHEFFREEGFEFTVFPVWPFELSITYPQAGQVITPIHGTIQEGWPLPVHTFSVRARITDEDGNPFANYADILTNVSGALSAHVLAGSGVSQTLTLTRDPAAPGAYFGELSGFDYEGGYRVVVRLESGYTERYRPLNTVVERDFSRADGQWNRARTYYILLAIILAVLFVILLYNVLIRTNKVNGSLVFLDANAEIAEIGLKSGVSWRKIGPRELRNYPQLMLKRLRVVNRGRVRRRAKVAEDAVLGAMFADSGHPGVRVHCVTESGRRFTQDLDPGLPVGYSDDTMAQMMFKPPE